MRGYPLLMVSREIGRIKGVAFLFCLIILFHFSSGPTAGRRKQTEKDWPYGITCGPDNNLWFTEYAAGRIGRLNPQTGEIKEFAIAADAQPACIIVGKDGNLWFTEWNGNKIACINPTTEKIKEYELPKRFSHPEGIASSPDGSLWFCEQGVSKLGRMDLKRHTIQEYDQPKDSQPLYLTMDTQGNVWYCDAFASSIRCFNPRTKTLRAFKMSEKRGGGWRGIIHGLDGNIWYVNNGGSLIGSIHCRSGKIQEYELPDFSWPAFIVFGRDKNIWVTQHGSPDDRSGIGCLNPRNGKIKHYLLAQNDDPEGITVGPDGNLWFTIGGGITNNPGNMIGRINPKTGEIKEFPLPAKKAERDTTGL